MAELSYDTFDALMRAVQSNVMAVGVGCEVESSDDVLSRRYGYQVVTRDGDITIHRIPITKLKSDPWAKRLTDSDWRDRITKALAVGNLPNVELP